MYKKIETRFIPSLFFLAVCLYSEIIWFQLPPFLNGGFQILPQGPDLA